VSPSSAELAPHTYDQISSDSELDLSPADLSRYRSLIFLQLTEA